MCEKCVEIDEKIARYRAMLAALDVVTVERILQLIADLEQRKIWLH